MKLQLAVIDTETDPFQHGRTPRPFALEFYTDGLTETFWGDDCIGQFATWLEKQPTPYLIYAHNGGKFDFHFLHEFIDNPIQVIRARIVSASMFHHTLRDSYAILPVPLRDYEKDTFDYAKMERNRRERHKREILDYLHGDCASLYGLVSKFIDQFGVRLTIGGTAMREVKKRYQFERMNAHGDAQFRPYYFGGRVQCFRSGVLKGPWKTYDINSQYPYVMKTRKHPVNGRFDQSTRMPRSFKRPFFLRFTGKNYGALPSRLESRALTFEREQGEFFACSHELEVALDHGLVKIDKVHECWTALETITFDTYVSEFFEMKLRAEKAGDKAGRLFAKLLLNSAYGKFAQDGSNFVDYHVCREDDAETHEALEDDGWKIAAEYPQFSLWEKPSTDPEAGLYDVSIAASITSAARALLLEGIQNAHEPIYCDTDSIVCKRLKGEISPTTLGAFKDEGTAKFAAIAGKKMYALYDDPKGQAMKLASKGGSLMLKDILEMCRGGIVEYERDAPSFSTFRPVNTEPSKLFVKRKFRMTAKTLTKDQKRK